MIQRTDYDTMMIKKIVNTYEFLREEKEDPIDPELIQEVARRMKIAEKDAREILLTYRRGYIDRAGGQYDKILFD